MPESSLLKVDGWPLTVGNARRSGVNCQPSTVNLRKQSNERLELALVLPPALDGGAVDRLADLDGAGRCHGSCVLVERKTCGVPGQPAKLDDSPRLALRIRHYLFVLHLGVALQSTPGPSEGIEHEVVTAGIEQVVRVVVVREAGGEELPVVAETGVERVAAQADDLRARQRAANQACVEKVERHLV